MRISKDYFRGFIYLLIGVFILLAALNLMYRFFDHDELEHIHSAWYVAGGYHPYRDFFQVHHPLLWVVSAPWIWIFGAAVPIMFWLRGLMMAFTLGSIVLVYHIAREMSRSKEVGRMAALFLASTAMFWEKGIEVRPDVPMVFLSHRPQLQRIRYVLENSDKTDHVDDGDIQFNLFRWDIHYFWYGLRKGKEFDAYNDVTGHIYADYDVCKLIEQKRPRFISDFSLNLSRCRLDKRYRYTGYKSLYFRVDLP